MIVEGGYIVHAPRQTVWDLLNNPDTLARLLPGCERITETAPNRYEAVLKVGVASIKGTYTGSVTIENPHPPESYELRIDGKGAGGFVRGTAAIALADRQSETEVSVRGDAQVGGPVAAVGQRLLGSAAKMMLGEFFKALDAEARPKA